MMGFRLFFKIIKSNIVAVVAYLTILILSGLIFGLSTDNNETEFKLKAPIFYYKATEETLNNLPNEEKEIFTYLVENDLLVFETNDPISKSLYEYSLNFLEHKDVEPENIVEANYTQIIHGALILPNNLSTLEKGDAKYIFHTYFKELAYAEPVKAALNKYINTYYNVKETYELEGINYSEIELGQKISNSLKKETIITFENPEDIELIILGRFYSFTTYIISAIIILIVGIVIYEIKRSEIIRRIAISPYSMPKLIIGLIFGALVLSFLLVLLVYVLALISYTNKALTIDGFYFTLNLWLYTLPLTTLSMFLGLIITNIELVSIISTVFALAQAFFSGAFVPTSFLPQSIINLGKITPASYTIVINDLIVEKPSNASGEILLNILYIAIYFVVCLTISIIASKKITKKES